MLIVLFLLRGKRQISYSVIRSLPIAQNGNDWGIKYNPAYMVEYIEYRLNQKDFKEQKNTQPELRNNVPSKWNKSCVLDQRATKKNPSSYPDHIGLKNII